MTTNTDMIMELITFITMFMSIITNIPKKA